MTPAGSRFRRLRGGKTRDGLVSGVSSEKEEKEALSILAMARLRPVPLRDGNNDDCSLGRLACCRRRRLRGMERPCDAGEAGANGRFLSFETGGVARGASVCSSPSSVDVAVLGEAEEEIEALFGGSVLEEETSAGRSLEVSGCAAVGAGPSGAAQTWAPDGILCVDSSELHVGSWRWCPFLQHASALVHSPHRVSRC